MTKMTIIDVVNLVYPGQQTLGNVTYGQDRNGPIFITKWTVPDVPQPTTEELEAMMPSLQAQFDLLYFTTSGQMELMGYLDQVANQRQYSSALSCASYFNSTVEKWKSEANVFVAWRDSVFNYTLEQINLMKEGKRSVPSFQEFQTELPVIAWPA